MRRTLTAIAAVALAVCLSSCTYRAVQGLNREIIADLEHGIATVDRVLEVERAAAWDAKIAALKASWDASLAKIKTEASSPDELLRLYEGMKINWANRIEQEAVLLEHEWNVRRENRLRDFLNALKTARGVEELLASYVEPDWVAVEALVGKARAAIWGG